MIKVLNLYAGIGGNRKLWPADLVQVTAVEKNKEIAGIYSEYFPDDEMIVGDAHKYLLDHYSEFDFVWASRPCISHSRSRMWASAKGTKYKPLFPDMGLYEEIIFLKHYYEGKYVCENVKPYYGEPLVPPAAEIGRHLFWTNFKIKSINETTTDVLKVSQTNYGFDLTGRKINHRKDAILRNCVNPELGLHLFNCAYNIITKKKFDQIEMFD